MNDSEHTKTSLYLTDVAVLRNEGDTLNLCGRNITMTSRGFEARISTELVQSLSSLHWIENSKTTASLGRRFTVIGARVNNTSCNVGNVPGVMLLDKSLKQTAISLSSCEAEFCAASSGAGELFGLAELCQGTSPHSFSSC